MSDPIEPMTDTPEKIARLRLAGHKALCQCSECIAKAKEVLRDNH